MPSVSETMSGDHVRCDDLFAQLEPLAEAGDWGRCLAACEAFVTALLQHFDAEEGLLFPAFEARTGMHEGPTRVMRSEHAQMRALLEQLQAAAAQADGAAFADAAETLLILMQQHNLKEENILYPMCDQALDDTPQLGAQLGQRLGGGCHV
jgi:iron-sulfur cluster repair protein YtfE (RIC family)